MREPVGPGSLVQGGITAEQESLTTTALQDRVGSGDRFDPTARLRTRRSIRPPRCAVGDFPVFVDGGRRRLTAAAVVACIVALALWWGMLALAFAQGTSGANPPLVEGGDPGRPAYEGIAAGAGA